ncbi:hypothetical protein [uncultured Chitinophaga sp.]|uniref:hypothetical protein n=1 Tax=uncultured Chitinophaga sp. TaxID=339340 RepID=UPI00260B3082|nr:hypothetical protein [uncultured Chitinophaga sp.]
MDNRSNIPGISFINQLPYALHIYDSGGWKDPDNYFGKLTLLGTVAANATGYVQPLQTTSVFVVCNAATGSPLARYVKTAEDNADSFNITTANEAAMRATFQFIDDITHNTDGQLSAAFKAIRTGTPNSILMETVNYFFSQQPEYTACSFETYMMAISATEAWARSVKRGITDIVNPMGDILRFAFGKNASETALILRNAGFSAREIAAILKSSFEQNAGQTALVMNQAGYPPNEVVSALKIIFSLQEIASVLKDVYGFNMQRINDILQKAGYPANTIEGAFKSLGGDYANFAKRVWDKLNPSHW